MKHDNEPSDPVDLDGNPLGGWPAAEPNLVTNWHPIQVAGQDEKLHTALIGLTTDPANALRHDGGSKADVVIILSEPAT